MDIQSKVKIDFNFDDLVKDIINDNIGISLFTNIVNRIIQSDKIEKTDTIKLDIDLIFQNYDVNTNNTNKITFDKNNFKITNDNGSFINFDYTINSLKINIEPSMYDKLEFSIKNKNNDIIKLGSYFYNIKELWVLNDKTNEVVITYE